MLSYGNDLAAALLTAIKHEPLVRHHWVMLQLGAPELLTDQEMDDVAGRYQHYGNARLPA